MSTYTFTGTDTYSVADVKAVMKNTYEDIIGFANRKLLTYEHAEKWIEDITYILNKYALKYFEIQLYDSKDGNFKSYHYDVDSWGFLSSNDKSGGINYFDIPSGTTLSLFVALDKDSSNYSKILKELTENRGWGTNGKAMTGTTSYERSYNSNNLTLKRSVITK